MAIVYCEDCDEQICSDCEGEEIGTDKYVCDSCSEQRAEEEKSGVDLSAEVVSCGNCGAITRDWIDKLEGKRCRKCAHAIEIDLIGIPHDAVSCSICTPPKAA